MYEMKAGRSRMDKVTGEKIILPGIEDSYDRLVEANLQFADQMYDLEEEVILSLLIEKLNSALELLSVEEMEIVRQLYYEEINEVRLSEKLGMPRRTLRDKKKKILEKLRKLMI